MNKKQVKKIFLKTKNRTKKITILTILVIILASFSALLISLGINKQVNYYIHYNEESDLDYRVYLKKNDYFGPYLGKDKQYIASLIDYVSANFNYKFSIDEKIDYKY